MQDWAITVLPDDFSSSLPISSFWGVRGEVFSEVVNAVISVNELLKVDYLLLAQGKKSEEVTEIISYSRT